MLNYSTLTSWYCSPIFYKPRFEQISRNYDFYQINTWQMYYHAVIPRTRHLTGAHNSSCIHRRDETRNSQYENISFEDKCFSAIRINTLAPTWFIYQLFPAAPTGHGRNRLGRRRQCHSVLCRAETFVVLTRSYITRCRRYVRTRGREKSIFYCNREDNVNQSVSCQWLSCCEQRSLRR